MKTIVECHSSVFDGVKNPYTGEPIVVKMMVPATGEPLFFAPDTFSPAEPVGSKAQAMENWDRVDGVYGLKEGRPVRCPYTGKMLHMEHDAYGYRLEGGFDPHQFRPRAEFLYFLHMRDGVPDPEFSCPNGSAPVVSAGAEKVPVGRTDSQDISEDAEKTAVKIVEKCADRVGIKKKTAVSVPRAVHKHKTSKRK